MDVAGGSELLWEARRWFSVLVGKSALGNYPGNRTRGTNSAEKDESGLDKGEAV